jgi:hypothetical protein
VATADSRRFASSSKPIHRNFSINRAQSCGSLGSLNTRSSLCRGSIDPSFFLYRRRTRFLPALHRADSSSSTTVERTSYDTDDLLTVVKQASSIFGGHLHALRDAIPIGFQALGNGMGGGQLAGQV